MYVLLIILTGSCISKKKLVYTKYYLLEPPHKSLNSEVISPKSDISVEIGSINVGPAYASTRIAHRDRSNEIVYFSYHEWAVLPEVSIAQMVMNYFRSTHQFDEVANYISNGEPDYRLDVHVSKIEMLNVGKETNAHILISYIYSDAATGQVVLQHTYDKSSKMPEKDINVLAQSISKLLWESLGQIFNQIADYHNSDS